MGCFVRISGIDAIDYKLLLVVMWPFLRLQRLASLVEGRGGGGGYIGVMKYIDNCNYDSEVLVVICRQSKR